MLNLEVDNTLTITENEPWFGLTQAMFITGIAAILIFTTIFFISHKRWGDDMSEALGNSAFATTMISPIIALVIGTAAGLVNNLHKDKLDPTISDVASNFGLSKISSSNDEGPMFNDSKNNVYSSCYITKNHVNKTTTKVNLFCKKFDEKVYQPVKPIKK